MIDSLTVGSSEAAVQIVQESIGDSITHALIRHTDVGYLPLHQVMENITKRYRY